MTNKNEKPALNIDLGVKIKYPNHEFENTHSKVEKPKEKEESVFRTLTKFQV